MSMTATSDPPFSNLGRRANKMTEQMMQKGYFNFCPSETWTPSVNLYETDNNYLVCVDLAGVDKEKIDLQVQDTLLTVRGQREVPMHEDAAAQSDEESSGAQGKRLRVHLLEIDHGAFCRQVELPAEIARDQISAKYLNGMLWIEIPKS